MQIIIIIAAIVLCAIPLPKDNAAQITDLKPVTTQEVKKEIEPIKETPKEVVPEPVVEAPIQKPVITSGNCYQWLLDAGVTDMVNAVELQRRENASCNPQLYNLGGSDACGVAQELPCGKSGCGMPPNADGACQIRWMNSYVLDRYGSWSAAVQFHDRMNWY